KLADTLDRYYALLGAACARADGLLIKLIGDGALCVFDPERGDDVVKSLLAVREEIGQLMSERSWLSYPCIKLHCGDVVVGPFGPDKRVDVIGREVNLTARLQTRSFAISAEAFRTLSKDGRALFKKHTAPVTYIPLDDRRPSLLAKG